MKNGTKGALELFKIIAQFLIVPTILLVWNIWMTMDVVKEKVIRMDVTLSGHITEASTKFGRMDTNAAGMTNITQRLSIMEHDLLEMKSEIKEMGASLDSHRQKSDYEPKSR